MRNPSFFILIAALRSRFIAKPQSSHLYIFDYLHKESTKIANLYDVVCVESLDMKAISNKGFGNGKATLDNGYGMFLNMLEYKLADRGKYFVKIDKWYPSSQLCSCCGKQKKLTLTDRIYKCDDCGFAINRDLNAAINIKNGLRCA